MTWIISVAIAVVIFAFFILISISDKFADIVGSIFLVVFVIAILACTVHLLLFD